MAIDTQTDQGFYRRMTCIVCPTGCLLEVRKGADGKLSITGFQCRRGRCMLKTKAEPEEGFDHHRQNSQRQPAPAARENLRRYSKELLAEAMRVLAQVEVTAPVKTGDAICPISSIQALMSSPAGI